MKKCKIEECDNPRATEAWLCTEHLKETRQCQGTVYEYRDDPATGERVKTGRSRQCKRNAMPGLTVCHDHGGSGPQAKAVSRRTGVLTTMEAFAKPYEGHLDPILAFEAEFRLTYGRIQWLLAQIAKIEDEREFIWGLVKEEHVGASEFAGINRTYAAQLHPWEEQLRWERKHLHDLEKTYLKTNIETKRIETMQREIDDTTRYMSLILKAFDLDMEDPAVRQKVIEVLTQNKEALS